MRGKGPNRTPRAPATQSVLGHPCPPAFQGHPVLATELTDRSPLKRALPVPQPGPVYLGLLPPSWGAGREPQTASYL